MSQEQDPAKIEALVDELRRQVIETRKSFSSQEVQRLSTAIMRRFLAGYILGETPLSIGIYFALPGEVDPRGLEGLLRAKGHRVCFPRVTDSYAKSMEFVEVSSSALNDEAQWQTGTYGIREPRSGLPVVRPEELDLIIVPGVVFGAQGQRIGRGGGFYDRYLGQAPQALKLSLVFDFQIQRQVPQQKWDQPVHWIFSESREMRTPFVETWKSRRK